jgi:ornithine cyclodeaminase/alanine dehydrogenase-like protein (mu-crystallin family)
LKRYRHLGRVLAGERTVFKSTGHAALDGAAASVAYQVARERGFGLTVDL